MRKNKIASAVLGLSLAMLLGVSRQSVTKWEADYYDGWV